MQQEELARLFSANMNLSQPLPHQTPPPQLEQQAFAEQPVQQAKSQDQEVISPITYVSQHYTHSYHVVPNRNVPSTTEMPQVEVAELEAVLLRNSIDPSLLFPSQIDLFQNADYDQRLRLLELWRISPPQGRQGYPDGVDYNTSRQLYDWPPTSLAQEEAMAKLRYERMMEERVQTEAIGQHQEQMDQSMDESAGSVAVQATQDILASSPDRNAEPYIVSGYDMLAKREYEESAKYSQATDPVYNNAGLGRGPWDKNISSMLAMENQYGAFTHAREYDVHPIFADQEMVM